MGLIYRELIERLKALGNSEEAIAKHRELISHLFYEDYPISYIDNAINGRPLTKEVKIGW